jgi:hypothetical protein
MPTLMRAIAILLPLLLLACAGSSDLRERERSMAEANALAAVLAGSGPAPLGPNDVRVRLAFGAEADLDLYVTGPAYETVYFANSPGRTGGELERDMRCDAPAPRIEVVRYSAASAGPYRVGVDFPGRCDGGRDAVVFVAVLQTAHGSEERRQTIRPGEFLPVVIEAVLEP